MHQSWKRDIFSSTKQRPTSYTTAQDTLSHHEPRLPAASKEEEQKEMSVKSCDVVESGTKKWVNTQYCSCTLMQSCGV
eukprot:330049-Pelagomonas_calceolata.AAC.2